MTYNLHSAYNSQGRQDLEAIAQVIEESGADVVALQEVSRGWLIDGSTDMAGWLSRRLGMPILFRGTTDPVWGNAISRATRSSTMAGAHCPWPARSWRAATCGRS